MSEDADAGVSVVYVVPWGSVGSDDVAGVLEPVFPDDVFAVFEAVFLDVFVGRDFSLDVANCLFWVVVFVVVVAPEGVV